MQNEIMDERGDLNLRAIKDKAPIEMAVDILRYFATKKFIKDKLDSLSKDKSTMH